MRAFPDMKYRTRRILFNGLMIVAIIALSLSLYHLTRSDKPLSGGGGKRSDYRSGYLVGTSGIRQTMRTYNTKFEDFKTLQVVCEHNDFIIISGIAIGKSDIYTNVDYGRLVKPFFLNMINHDIYCGFSVVQMRLMKARYIKVAMISELIMRTTKIIYWTDVDTAHLSLKFIQDFSESSCMIGASKEEEGITDHHFEKYHKGEVKLMQGNILIRPSQETREFVKLWYGDTMLIDSVVDDQWAFENIYTKIHSVCQINFMSYTKNTVVRHFVSEYKIKRSRDFFSEHTELISIPASIQTFKNNLNSDLCSSYLMRFRSSITVINRIPKSGWDDHNPNYILDDDIDHIFALCVGYQPFTRFIQKVDFVRYLAVYKLGGWYFDSDTRPSSHVAIQDLFQRAKSHSLIVSVEELINAKVTWVVCQWAFYSIRENPFLLNLMEDILVDNFLYSKLFLPTSWLTGPMRFTRNVALQNPDRLELKMGDFTNGSVVHGFEGSWLSDESWDDLTL